MKKAIYPIIFLLTYCPALKAQETKHLKIQGTEITLMDSIVCLSFEVDAHRNLNRRGATAVFLPQITGGANTVCFTPVVVQSRRSQLAWQRHAWAAGDTTTYGEAVYLKRGAKARYQADVTLQQWMRGADLKAEILVAGCCSTDHDYIHIASNVLPALEPEPVAEPEPEIIILPDFAKVEEIMSVFPFVLPISEFDPDNAIRFYDDERDNAITVYYNINRYDIDENYADNRQALLQIIAAIEFVRESTDSEVSRVVIAGFSSPEGPFQLNDRLAWERAVSVKEHIIKHSGVADGLVTLYNGSADWQGLRLLVDRDRTMPGRDEVLRIIDHYPVWDSRTQTGRMGRIMNLHEGRVYRYIAEHIFPRLRNGAFIRVYYDHPKSNSAN